MSKSAKKGEDYEDKVSRLVDDLLKSGELPFNVNSCVFHRWKSYFSNDRQSNIEFENVLELFSDGVDKNGGQPVLVIIFECKSYKNLVDVSEVEEFVSKLDQLRGFRTKGFMVTTKGFKSGAISLARSKGVGLIRFVPREQHRIILYHMTSLQLHNTQAGFAKRAGQGLTNPNYIADHEIEFAFDDGYVFPSAEAAVRNSIQQKAKEL